MPWGAQLTAFPVSRVTFQAGGRREAEASSPPPHEEERGKAGRGAPCFWPRDAVGPGLKPRSGPTGLLPAHTWALHTPSVSVLRLSAEGRRQPGGCVLSPTLSLPAGSGFASAARGLPSEAGQTLPQGGALSRPPLPPVFLLSSSPGESGLLGERSACDCLQTPVGILCWGPPQSESFLGGQADPSFLR